MEHGPFGLLAHRQKTGERDRSLAQGDDGGQISTAVGEELGGCGG
jgi:hypothetical protein